MAFEKTLEERLTAFYSNRSKTIRKIDNFYSATYPLILDFFREKINRPDFAEVDAKLGVVLVYSWMAPAKLNVDYLKKYEPAKSAIEKIRSGEGINRAQLESMIAFVGGSLIATSKYLHFLCPARFAIWDRRVAGAAYRLNHHYQYNNLELYLTYLDDLKKWRWIPMNVQQNDPGLATDMRKKELALFELGISEQT